MNYVIISAEGNSFYLIPRLNAITQVAKIYYCIGDMPLLGKGLNELPEYAKLEMVQDYQYALNRCDKQSTYIILDDVGLGETGDALRKQGWKTIGGGKIADQLEEDRTFATDLMKKVMPVPETYTFDTFTDGLAFLKSQDTAARFVFKPSDAEAPKEYTYVSKDIADLVGKMKEFRIEWAWKTQFQLQKMIQGTEVDFNAYFNGREYINLTMYFENKAVMNDDVGPSGGGAIAVCFTKPYVGVFADILEKIKPIFIRDGYRGCVAINSIVGDDGKIYFIEFTNRFGYPALPMDITSLEDNGKTIHDLFTALITGTNPKLFPLNKPAIVVSVGVPGYPTKYAEKNKGVPIAWSEEWDTYFFPSYIMRDERKGIVLAGISNECLQVTCSDATIDGAVSMLYDTYMPTLRLKGAMYRTDVGKDAKKRIQRLRDKKLL